VWILTEDFFDRFGKKAQDAIGRYFYWLDNIRRFYESVFFRVKFQYGKFFRGIFFAHLYHPCFYYTISAA